LTDVDTDIFGRQAPYRASWVDTAHYAVGPFALVPRPQGRPPTHLEDRSRSRSPEYRRRPFGPAVSGDDEQTLWMGRSAFTPMGTPRDRRQTLTAKVGTQTLALPLILAAPTPRNQPDAGDAGADGAGRRRYDRKKRTPPNAAELAPWHTRCQRCGDGHPARRTKTRPPDAAQLRRFTRPTTKRRGAVKKTRVPFWSCSRTSSSFTVNARVAFVSALFSPPLFHVIKICRAPCLFAVYAYLYDRTEAPPRCIHPPHARSRSSRPHAKAFSGSLRCRRRRREGSTRNARWSDCVFLCKVADDEHVPRAALEAFARESGAA